MELHELPSPSVTTPKPNALASKRTLKGGKDSTPTPAKRPCREARSQATRRGLHAKDSEQQVHLQSSTAWRLAEPCAGLPAGTHVQPSDAAIFVGSKAVDSVGGNECFLEMEKEADEDEEDEDEGSISDGGLSEALSEGLERLLWSEDEEDEDEPSTSRDDNRIGAQAALSSTLVPVAAEQQRPAALSEALAVLRSLPLPVKDAETPEAATVLPLPAPCVAYGRSRRRTEDNAAGASALQAVGAAPQMLALPPPAPLSALPPLSALLEAGRSALRASQAEQLPPPKVVPDPTDWLYPSRPYPTFAWQWDCSGGPPRQGQAGFRRYVQRALERFRESGEESEALKASGERMPLQLYQLRVSFLLHPLSPLSRLLVVHATGAGKTRTVLSAADSFYRSGKATCLFFPEEAVRDNFYQELLKFPGSWRDFFCASEGVQGWRERRHRCWSAEEVAEFPTSQVEACLGLERKVRLGEISHAFLEEWSQLHPDVPPPLAPLRAFKYTTAGGSRGGWRRSGAFEPGRMDTVFRFGFDGKNPMSNKNLVFDEVHNLLALPRWRGNYWKEPLRRLRKAVRDCTGSTVVFLTGSPVQTDGEDGNRLLRVLKGTEHAAAGPEGWLDMHLERSPEHFPKVFPAGVPDRPLSPQLERDLVLPVEMPDEMVTKYREVEAQGGDAARLRDCCNLAVHHTWALRPQKRSLVLEDSAQHAAKLLEVAKSVWSKGEKAMAAVSRRGGLQVLKELLRLHAPDDHVQIAVFSGRSSSIVSREEEEAVDPSEALRRFNSPDLAEVRVLLLDTAFGREGLSALGVGQLHLVDVPGSWAEYKQTVGRAIRFGDVTPGGRRSLQVHLWVARLSDDESADEALLAQLRHQGEHLCAAEDELASLRITAQDAVANGGAHFTGCPVMLMKAGAPADEQHGFS